MLKCVAGPGAVAVPLNAIVCVVLGLAFSASAVNTNDPLLLPTVAGLKLTSIVQELPRASVATLEEVLSCGQVPLLPRVNPVAMLGFIPAAGTRILRSALPMFDT